MADPAILEGQQAPSGAEMGGNKTPGLNVEERPITPGGLLGNAAEEAGKTIPLEGIKTVADADEPTFANAKGGDKPSALAQQLRVDGVDARGNRLTDAHVEAELGAVAPGMPAAGNTETDTSKLTDFQVNEGMRQNVAAPAGEPRAITETAVPANAVDQDGNPLNPEWVKSVADRVQSGDAKFLDSYDPVLRSAIQAELDSRQTPPAATESKNLYGLTDAEAAKVAVARSEQGLPTTSGETTTSAETTPTPTEASKNMYGLSDEDAAKVAAERSEQGLPKTSEPQVAEAGGTGEPPEDKPPVADDSSEEPANNDKSKNMYGLSDEDAAKVAAARSEQNPQPDTRTKAQNEAIQKLKSGEDLTDREKKLVEAKVLDLQLTEDLNTDKLRELAELQARLNPKANELLDQRADLAEKINNGSATEDEKEEFARLLNGTFNNGVLEASQQDAIDLAQNQVEQDAISKGFNAEDANFLARVVSNPTKEGFYALTPEQQNYAKNSIPKETFDRLVGAPPAEQGPFLSNEQRRQLLVDRMARGESLTKDEYDQLGPDYGPEWDEEFDTEQKRLDGANSTDPEKRARYEAYKERQVKKAEDEAREKIRLERIEEIFKGMDDTQREKRVQEVFDKYYSGEELSVYEQAVFDTHEPGLSEETRESYLKKSDQLKEEAFNRKIREMTTSQRKDELDRLNGKMQRGETLTDEENKRFNALRNTEKLQNDDFKNRDLLIDKKSKDGLTAEEEQKLAEINERLKNVELTDDQMDAEINKVYARIRESYKRGEFNENDPDVELFKRLKTEKALRENGIEASRAKIMAAEGLKIPERRRTAVERETQEMLQKMASLELQLLAIPRQVDALKGQIGKLKRQIAQKKNSISFLGKGEQESKKRLELYPLMQQLASTKGSLAYSKNLNLYLYAEFTKTMADLNDKLRLNGRLGFYKNWMQHAKAGVVSKYADMKTDFDSINNSDDEGLGIAA